MCAYVQVCTRVSATFILGLGADGGASCLAIILLPVYHTLIINPNKFIMFSCIHHLFFSCGLIPAHLWTPWLGQIPSLSTIFSTSSIKIKWTIINKMYYDKWTIWVGSFSTQFPMFMSRSHRHASSDTASHLYNKAMLGSIFSHDPLNLPLDILKMRFKTKPSTVTQ